MKRNAILSSLVLLPLFSLAWRADGALNCSFVSVTGVNFGSYDVLNTNPTTSTGTITYRCTGAPSGGPVQIQLAAGSGTFANRTLRSGPSNVLSYNLYPDASYSQAWGDGTSGTYQYVVSPSNGQVSLTVYGRIFPAGQDVGVGNYTDSITVTMNF